MCARVPVVGDGHVGVHEVADADLHLQVVNHAPLAVDGEGVALLLGRGGGGSVRVSLSMRPCVCV